jgi:nicotinamide-nucleotide amidase
LSGNAAPSTRATPHVSNDEKQQSASSSPAPIEVRLNALLTPETEITVAAAESCTGGNVANRITSVAGSSIYFLGSIVSYANSAKVQLLAVSEEILETRGAVSEECARAMVEGARIAFDADIAVSTTGIAGPGGGTDRKPVGLVYISSSGPSGIYCREYHFGGDRRAVIDAATEAALEMLLAEAERAVASQNVVL